MDATPENTDMSKYGYEARIYSADGKYEKIITEKSFEKKLTNVNILLF
jgi:hypothetical protein